MILSVTLILAAPLHTSVTVDVTPGAQASQDFALASLESGPWSTGLYRLPVQPGHSYSLRVQCHRELASAPIRLIGHFELKNGSSGPSLASLEARTAFPKIQQLSGLVAPPGAASWCFSFVGQGLGNSWWRGCYLQDEGFQPPLPSSHLKGGHLELIDLNKIVTSSGESFEIQIPTAWAGRGGRLSAEEDAEALTLVWEGFDTGREAPIQSFMIKGTPGDAWILPFNEGLRIPVTQANKISVSYDLSVRAGHFLSLPLLGLQRGPGILLIIDTTPEDSNFRFWPKESEAGFKWLASLGAWGQKRRLRLSWIAQGGVSALANTYRRWKDAEAPPVTLAVKRQRVPALQKLAGAVDIHFWKDARHWSKEPEPARIGDAFKGAGLDRVLWSQAAPAKAVASLSAEGYLPGRYENFQDLYPPETPYPWMDKEAWDQVTLKEDGSWLRGWVAREAGKDYPAGVRNPSQAYELVHSRLRAGQKSAGYEAVFLDTTTASAPTEDWSVRHPLTRVEDMQAKSKQLDIGSAKFGLVTGSESGQDGAINNVHYFEGMLSPWCGRFDDSGYDLVTRHPPTQSMMDFNLSPVLRIPLFELAYHECVVNYEYWGDAANRLPDHWRFRDLLSCLYGQPELWVLDRDLWQAQKDLCIRSFRTWSPVVRHLFGQKMLGWKALNPEATQQETTWEDGSVVRVDFAGDRLTLTGPVAQAGAAQ